jgi:hypothetical protein
MQAHKIASAIVITMTKDQVKAVLDRVLTWPPEVQEKAVASLATIEEQLMPLQPCPRMIVGRYCVVPKTHGKVNLRRTTK